MAVTSVGCIFFPKLQALSCVNSVHWLLMKIDKCVFNHLFKMKSSLFHLHFSLFCWSFERFCLI